MTHLGQKTSFVFLPVLLSGLGLLWGGLEADKLSAQFAVSKGKGRVKRAEAVIELAVGSESRSLKAGDQVSTAEKSAARIALGDKDAVELMEKTSVVFRKLRLSPEKRIITLALSLEEGTVKPSVRGPTKEEITKKKVPTYDFQVMIGEAVVSGPRFVGKVVRGPKGEYTVDAYEGKPIVQHGKLFIQLASGVTVNPGPPLTVTALPTNTEPVVAAYIGAVVFVLQPGQSVRVDVLPDGSVRITNMGPQPLYASSWDGSPIAVPPGGSHSFDVVETEADLGLARAHVETIVDTVIDTTFPDAFPGEPGAQGEDDRNIFWLPVDPREDDGGGVRSPDEELGGGLIR